MEQGLCFPCLLFFPCFLISSDHVTHRRSWLQSYRKPEQLHLRSVSGKLSYFGNWLGLHAVQHHYNTCLPSNYLTVQLLLQSPFVSFVPMTKCLFHVRI